MISQSCLPTGYCFEIQSYIPHLTCTHNVLNPFVPLSMLMCVTTYLGLICSMTCVNHVITIPPCMLDKEHVHHTVQRRHVRLNTGYLQYLPSLLQTHHILHHIALHCIAHWIVSHRTGSCISLHIHCSCCVVFLRQEPFDSILHHFLIAEVYNKLQAIKTITAQSCWEQRKMGKGVSSTAWQGWRSSRLFGNNNRRGTILDNVRSCQCVQ